MTPLEAARAPLAHVRVAGGRRGREPGGGRAARVGRLVAGARERVPQPERSAPPRRAREAEDELLRVRLEDRKSTRLNSSHLVISYAVFCLKKKNKKNCTTTF